MMNNESTLAEERYQSQFRIMTFHEVRMTISTCLEVIQQISY